MEIVDQEEEGWWEVIHNGKRGMVPSNFVQEISEEEAGITAQPGERFSMRDAMPPNPMQLGRKLSSKHMRETLVRGVVDIRKKCCRE